MRYYFLDWAKVVIIGLVVVYHYFNLNSAVPENAFCTVVDLTAMPVMFLISGIVAALNDTTSVRAFYAKRIGKLLPILFVCVFFLNLIIYYLSTGTLTNYYTEAAFIWSSGWFDSVYWYLWYLLIYLLILGLIAKLPGWVLIPGLVVVLSVVNVLDLPGFNSRFSPYYFAIFFFFGYMVQRFLNVVRYLKWDYRGPDLIRESSIYVYILHLPVLMLIF